MEVKAPTWDAAILLRQIHHVELLSINVPRLLDGKGFARLLLEGVHEEHLVLAPLALRLELLAVGGRVLAHAVCVLIFRWCGGCGCCCRRVDGVRVVRSMRAVLPGAVGAARGWLSRAARSNGRGCRPTFGSLASGRCERYHRSTELLAGAGIAGGTPSFPSPARRPWLQRAGEASRWARDSDQKGGRSPHERRRRRAAVETLPEGLRPQRPPKS